MTVYQHYIIALYSTAIAVFLLGIFVLKQQLKADIKIPYVLYSICISIWASGQALALQHANHAVSLFAVRHYCHSGVIFIPIFFIHFVFALLDKTTAKNKFIYFCYSVGFVFLVLNNFTSLLVRDVKSYPPIFNLVYVPGYLHPIMIAFFVSLVVYGNLLLLKAYKKASGEKYAQLKWLCWITIFAYIGGAPNFLLGYRIQIKWLMPFGTYLLPIYVAGTAYAIVRHQLMDIEVIIRRAAVFAGLLASVFAILILPTLLIQEYILRSAGFRARTIGLTISGIIIIFTMRRIEDLLIRLTDKFLFQKKYDYKELLKTFTGEVLTVLDLSKLVNVTTENLSKIIRLESCAVLIHDKDKDNYPISASLGLKEPSQVFAKTTHIINYLLKTHHYLLKNKTITDLPDIGTVKEDLKKLNAELVIPIVLHDDLMGALTLGRKKSGEDFTQDDLDILLPLSQTLAVAISNAQYLAELIKSESQNEKMKAIATLAAGMAHEIKNPLTAIKTYAAFMPKYWQDKNFIDKFNRVVPESVNRIDRIVKDLLAFSRPTPPEFKEVKISDIASHTLDYVSNDLVKNSINYNFDFKDNGAIIQADQNQLTQVFLNLFLNAVDAMPQGGMLNISSKIVNADSRQSNANIRELPISDHSREIRDNSRSNIVQICIKDTGCGISPENLSHIFDPFFTTKDTGTGLGLSIVQEIVSNHQGTIRAESEAGKGTTFILEFPLIDTAKT